MEHGHIEWQRLPSWEEAKHTYLRGEELGSGSYGTVYSGWQAGQTPVALKSVISDGPDMVLAEIKALRACQGHPCIIKLFVAYRATVTDSDGKMYCRTMMSFPRRLLDLRAFLERQGLVHLGLAASFVCD